ncbi:hypothetical protein DFP72DRAFT_1081679 [Ephemerocybe angulata]|uniref:Uncharacterized protein n=1 Tax=Ephemerocybe angulata TaxID=980116 RepID=A0A8H6HAP2_9AGAR|nr:hypothetical protein DFP72DRAFT_1081679 [Tulosesus angulatus]
MECSPQDQSMLPGQNGAQITSVTEPNGSGLPISDLPPITAGASVAFHHRNDALFKAAVDARPHIGSFQRCLPLLALFELYPAQKDVPEGLYTPQAKTYMIKKTRQYLRGFMQAAPLAAPWTTAEQDTEQVKMSHLITPKSVAPIVNEVTQCYEPQPIAGMVQMPPGMPCVHLIDGDEDKPHTVGAVHTLDSIQDCFPDMYDRANELCTALAVESFGSVPDEFGNKKIPALFDMNGLKTNNCTSPTKTPADPSPNLSSAPPASSNISADPSLAPSSTLSARPTQPALCDGSYSLGGTVMKGEGQGFSLPTAQAATKESREKIGKVVTILNELYDMNIKMSLSKAEYTLVGKSLEASLKSQGTLHCDNKDCICHWTSFFLLLNIPPGADSGPFLLGCSGLYCCELGVWIIWLCFKGNDIHGGFAPLEMEAQCREWLKSLFMLWDRLSPYNRLGFVCYCTKVTMDRVSGLNMLPPGMFGNIHLPA